MGSDHRAELIDEEVRVLSEIKRLLKNPIAVQALERLFGQNHRVDDKEVPTVIFGADPPVSEMTLQVACYRACLEMQSGEFSTMQVLNRVLAMGFDIKAADKRVAVNSTLKRLVAKGQLEQTGRAVGHRPASFKVIRRFPRE